MKLTTFIKSTFLVLFLALNTLTLASTYPSNSDNTEIGDDNYVGKRKRNHASSASKSSLSRQSKAAKKSIKRNKRHNKKHLSHRLKKQKRQKRFSQKDTFR